MQLHLKEKLEEFKYIKIHCMNQKQLLNLIDIVEFEKIELHYWMPSREKISQQEYFDTLRKVVLGNDEYEPYVGESQSAILTLRRNTHSIDLTISTTPKKYRQPQDGPVLNIDFTSFVRENLFEELGLY